MATSVHVPTPDPAPEAGTRPGRARPRRTRMAPGFWVALGFVGLVAVVAVLHPWMTEFSPTRAVATNRLFPPGTDGHLLGTDSLGRDVLARLLAGTRQAVVVGAVVSTASLVMGVVLGALAGHFAGWPDQVLSRAIDSILAFPALLLALVFAAIMGPSTTTGIVALSIAYTPLVARVVRAGVLAEQELDYVRASRGIGNGELRTLVVHVLPNVLGPLLVVATIVFSRSIIVEASLSFLGVGTQPPNPSWGVMIGDARDLILIHPRLVLYPAIVLSATVLAINTVADGLNDRWHAPGVISAGRK